MILKATRVGVNVIAYATGRELLRKLDLSEAIDCRHYDGTALEKGAYPEFEVRDKFPDSFID